MIMEKIFDDLLSEFQQIHIFGGEQEDSELKLWIGHCKPRYADCNKFCHDLQPGV